VDYEADEEAIEPKKSKAEDRSSLEEMMVDKDEPATKAQPNDTVSGSNKKKPKKKKAKKSALSASA
jgi:hypothetical protein